MGTTLHTLQAPEGHRRRRKRVGRGIGSGRGKTATRGMKGQRARNRARVGFEGGQNPIYRRVPKRGFVNLFRVEVHGVNVGRINDAFEEGAVVDEAGLRAHGLIPKRAKIIKLLADGDVSKKFTLKLHRASAAAREKVEAAGGSIELIEAPAGDSGDSAAN